MDASPASGININRIASLARLRLSDEEAVEYSAQLAAVLSYIEKLSELDTSQVEPTAHAMAVEDVLRDDVPGSCLDIDDVLGIAPATSADLILLPRVIET